MTQRKRIPGILLTLVALTALVAGCQTQNPVSSLGMNPFKSVEPTVEFQQPVRMAVIWKESAVSSLGKKPTRGFGGRIYFYNEDNETVRVDGKLSVYAYDDTNDADIKTRTPDRKYVFRAEDMQRHYSETSIGHSYNVWLPWDQVGGVRKTISLVPIFKPNGGMIPNTDHSIAILSGPSPTEDGRLTGDEVTNSVRQVSMTVPANVPNRASLVATSTSNNQGAQESRNKVRTTTFEVPRSIAARLSAAGPSTIRPRSELRKAEPTRKTRAVSRRQESSASEADSAAKNQRTSNAHSMLFPGGTDTEAPESQLKKPGVFGQPGSFR